MYPILAVSGNPWRFLATEADEVNFCYATKNLEDNKLTDRIKGSKYNECNVTFLKRIQLKEKKHKIKKR